jgi:hypothetical protein
VRAGGVPLIEQVGQDADDVVAELLVVAVGTGLQLVTRPDDLGVDLHGGTVGAAAAAPADVRKASLPGAAAIATAARDRAESDGTDAAWGSPVTVD